MKILFICSANKQRSKTAHHYFAETYPKFQFMSAGTNHKICKKEGSTPLTEDLLIWADEVYVMEEKHKNIIQKHTGSPYVSKLIVLNIPDIYEYNSLELLDVLKRSEVLNFVKLGA